jgi:molecular chaperone HscB
MAAFPYMEFDVVCWKCRESVQGPVCVGCRSIQPLGTGMDLFDLLGLPRRFFIDTAVIERCYREISRKVHPDRFAKRPAVERRMSLQWTASVNSARRVLLDPIRRAQYLATGSGEPRETGGPVMSPEFLEEVFELQMAQAEDPGGVAAKASAAKEKRLGRLDILFRSWETDGGSLEEVEALLAEMRYLLRISKT